MALRFEPTEPKEPTVHAVFSVAEFLPSTTEEAAMRFLNDQLIPLVKQQPGFVRAIWFGSDRKGHGVVLYETEEQAKQGVFEPGLEIGGVVTVSSEVYAFHGEA
jgi:hypothetical protein